jgi:plastocyanin
MVRVLTGSLLSFDIPRAPIALAALLAVALTAACSSDKQATAPLRTVEECIRAIVPPITGTQQVIAMRDFTFGPDSVRVAVGTTVTWANCEPSTIDPHTSTARAGEWKSGYIAPGAIYSRQFTTAGRFEYFCEPHPFMHGVIIVE